MCAAVLLAVLQLTGSVAACVSRQLTWGLSHPRSGQLRSPFIMSIDLQVGKQLAEAN